VTLDTDPSGAAVRALAFTALSAAVRSLRPRTATRDFALRPAHGGIKVRCSFVAVFRSTCSLIAAF